MTNNYLQKILKGIPTQERKKNNTSTRAHVNPLEELKLELRKNQTLFTQ
jgi:hypothetical protein